MCARMFVAGRRGEGQRKVMDELRRLQPLLFIRFFHGRLLTRRGRGMTRASRDVTFDFQLRLFDVLRQTGDLEDRLFVPARRDDVGVGRLLDAFDRRSFRTDHQTDHAIGNTDLNGRLLRR